MNKQGLQLIIQNNNSTNIIIIKYKFNSKQTSKFPRKRR